MDPRVHARFLDYLELRQYFAQPDIPKLDAKTFTSADAELRKLEARLGAERLTADEHSRIVELRRLLFRD